MPEAAAAAPEMQLTREFDAPVELVWKAFTEAKHVARWQAPQPFTMPRCEIDLRVGGEISYTMRSPEGAEHGFRATFREIVPNEKLVYVGNIEGLQGSMTTAVTFAAKGKKTSVTVRQTAPSNPEFARGQKMGWTASLDQLAATLAA